MNFPSLRYRYACLLLSAILAFQAQLNGQETIQPQRIVNLDKFLRKGSAPKPPQFQTPKLDLGLSKFKRAVNSPAFASKPQLSFQNAGSLNYRDAAQGFAAQVPNLQAAPGFQIQQSLPPNVAVQQFSALHDSAPINRVANLQPAAQPVAPALNESSESLVSTSSKDESALQLAQATEPILPLSQSPQRGSVEFELLPTFSESPNDSQRSPSEPRNFGSFDSPPEAPLNLLSEDNRPSNESSNLQPFGYIDPFGSVESTTQQQPASGQFGSQQFPQYGTQEIPQYGSQQPTQYGSQQIPQYGAQQIPQYGSQPTSPLNSQSYPTAPLPSFPVAPELGFTGGTFGYQEVGLNSPAHWGVGGSQAQLAPQPQTQQFIDPTTGAIVSIPGAIGHSYLPAGAHNGSFPINPGKREQRPMNRIGLLEDVGKPYDFQTKKKEFPPFRETLATGRYFASGELLFIKPHLQNNNAILIDSPAVNFGSSQPIDFSFDAATRFRVGFESKHGPGFELNYFQYDHDSSLRSFTSDGVATGTAGSFLTSPNASSSIVAQNAGEVLTASQSLEVHRLGATFFKDFKLPVTRLGGGLGIQQVRINHTLTAAVNDAAGNEVASLVGNHRFDAFGPQLYFRYFRPVGHTKLELIGGVSGAVLFGNRDLNVQNSVTGGFDQVGSNDVLMLFDVLAGVQYLRHTAENRSFYARITLMHEIWLGGGTAVSTADNFGFRGVGFGVGFNR